MDPTQLIEDLCRRHRVPRAFGDRLRPLLRRAQCVEPDARQRILDLVVRSFEEEARRQRHAEGFGERLAELPELDQRAIHSVASVLHGWAPPRWLLGWGGRRDS